MIHGTAFPVVMLIFGQLTDSFINQAVTQATILNGTNAASNCVQFLFNVSDTSAVTQAISASSSRDSVHCSAPFDVGTNSTSLRELIPGCYGEGRKCLSNDDFIDEINMQCYIFVGIAMAIFVLSGLQSLFFQFVAERQIHLIRQKFYRAILRQDIGWFDANPSGELSSRLSE